MFPSHRKETKSSQQDAMPYSNYFDNPYLNDAYLQTPDYPVNTFFDSESFFDQALASADVSNVPKAQTTLNPTLPPTGISASSSNQPLLRQTFTPTPFGTLEQYPNSFPFNAPQTQSNKPDCFSPTIESASQAPSLCGDPPFQTISPSLSPHMLRRTSPSPSSPISGSESSTPKRPTRKRGRPQKARSDTDTSVSTSSTLTSPTITKTQRSKRLPHNQVERKYREGLNSELERLRRAVPMLRGGGEETGAIGQPKPSKAMVLSSAIDYIERIERERDVLREENEMLRRERRVREGARCDGGIGCVGCVGAVGEDVDGFLMER